MEASTFTARQKQRSPLQRAVQIGLIFGVIAVYLAIVGLLLMFHGRWIIVDVLSLGHAALIAVALGAGIVIARGAIGRVAGRVLVHSLIAGAIAGGLLAVLVAAMQVLDLRTIFISLSPPLTEMLTFGLDVPFGMAILSSAAPCWRRSAPSWRIVRRWSGSR